MQNEGFTGILSTKVDEFLCEIVSKSRSDNILFEEIVLVKKNINRMGKAESPDEYNQVVREIIRQSPDFIRFILRCCYDFEAKDYFLILAKQGVAKLTDSYTERHNDRDLYNEDYLVFLMENLSDDEMCGVFESSWSKNLFDSRNVIFSILKRLGKSETFNLLAEKIKSKERRLEQKIVNMGKSLLEKIKIIPHCEIQKMDNVKFVMGYPFFIKEEQLKELNESVAPYFIVFGDPNLSHEDILKSEKVLGNEDITPYSLVGGGSIVMNRNEPDDIWRI